MTPATLKNRKRIALLGATGSIGKSSLDIISRDSENFNVVLLASHSNSDELEKVSKQFPDAVTVLAGAEGGEEKLLNAVTQIKPDMTINGISGSAGLKPSLAAINAGSDLALANKETIVMAGNLVMHLAKEKNINLIPVDSEHSAVFNLIKSYSNNGDPSSSLKNAVSQRLEASSCETINEIILTASGGPFRNLSLKEMEKVTVEDALSHPTWSMGKKITIDSASMANKGLEIIEACVLFNVPPEKIKVVIHPQSIVHSMIRLLSGVIYAQMSKPDMRHPVHDALYWPHIKSSMLETLNFDSLSLEFFKPDTEKFPMLRLARDAAKNGRLYPCAYNAANEIAAAAFIENKIGFLDIPRITEKVLQSDWSGDIFNLDEILNADTLARQIANSFINKK